MCVAEWARRMPVRRATFTRAVTVAPSCRCPCAQMADVQRETVFLLRVEHLEADARGDEFPRVADLPAAFAVERRAIEHDLDRLFVAVFRDRLDQMILGEDADDFSVGLDRFVAEKLACRSTLF